MKSRFMYSKNHLWVKFEDDIVIIGLSKYAQQKLGGIVFLNLPTKGDTFYEGDVFGDVESIKTVSDLIFPLQGEIIEVNEELSDNPENISEDIDGSWLVKVKVDKNSCNLMDELAYEEYIKKL